MRWISWALLAPLIAAFPAYAASPVNGSTYILNAYLTPDQPAGANLTPSVVILCPDPAGTKNAVDCKFSGSSSPVVTQGAQDSTAVPWQTLLYEGGTQVGAGNGLFIQPATGAQFSTNLVKINGTTINLGQAPMSGSLPVVLPSDENVLTNLAQIGGSAFSLGSKTSVGSMPVVVASDQTLSVNIIPGTNSTIGLPPTTVAAGTALLVKASAGNIYSYTLTQGGAAGYLVVYNAASAPTSGTALTASLVLACIPVAANGYVGLNSTVPIFRATAGIVLLSNAISGACSTYTPNATPPLLMTATAA